MSDVEYGSLPASRRKGRRLLTAVVFGLACAAALAVVVRMLTPPVPLPDDAPADQFSAQRAFKHIEAIAQEPHPLGSESIVAVREYIVEQLEEMGLEPELQSATAADYFDLQPGPSVTATNVLARIPGTRSTGSVMLLAHYDTVPWTTGANDCSGCVATLLETARALLAGPPLENDVILLFTDGEEPAPKYGATAFVEQHPLAADVRLVVAFEAIGSQGPVEMYETGHGNDWTIQEFAQAVSRPVAFSYLNAFIDLTALLSESYSTDFQVFKAAGVDGVSYANVYNSAIYHTPADNIESIHLSTLQHHGASGLELARHFGDLDLSRLQQLPQRDVIFFSLSRTVLAHYPSGWAVPLALLGGAVLAVALWLGLRRGRLAVRGIVTGLLASSLTSLLLCLGVAVIWWAIVEGRSRQGHIVGYTAAHLYLAIFLAGAAAAILGLYWLLRKKHSAAGLLSGALLWGWVLALVTGVTLPGLSYLFHWPVLLAGIGLGLSSVAGSNRAIFAARLSALAAATFAGFLLLTPFAYDFFQVAMPRPGNLDSQVVQLIGLPVFLAVYLAWLLIPLSGSVAGNKRQAIERHP